MIYREIKFEQCGDRLTHKLLIAYGYMVALPKDYEEFMCNINGGVPINRAFKFIDIDGHSAIEHIDFFWSANSNNQEGSGEIFPNRMIGIAYTLEGNMVLLSLKNPDRGKVYHWDSRYESNIVDPQNVGSDNLTLLAESFDDFLKMLYMDDENSNTP